LEVHMPAKIASEISLQAYPSSRTHLRTTAAVQYHRPRSRQATTVTIFARSINESTRFE
jgi:hypothetical protein